MDSYSNTRTHIYVMASTPILEFGLMAALRHPNYPQIEPQAVDEHITRLAPTGSIIIKTFLGDNLREVTFTRDRFPAVPMLALGHLGRLPDVNVFKRMGVNAYLDFSVSPEELRRAVLRLALEGTRTNSWRGAYVDETRAPVMQEAPTARMSGAAATNGIGRLSAREMEILRLVQQGARNKEIAATLILSENTVKTHIQRIMAKLDVNNRTQAAMLAMNVLRDPADMAAPPAA